MTKIYLASPYSDPDPAIREHRFSMICEKAGELMNEGYIVYSPIAHSHPIACQCELPTDWNFWEKFDRAFIEWADEVWVYMLPGWIDSRGVKAEIKIAVKLGKPVTMKHVT